MGLGDIERLFHGLLRFGSGSRPRAHQNVLAHRVREQDGVLESHGYMRAEVIEGDEPEVGAVDRDPAARDVVEARKELQQGALAAARDTHERHGLACFEPQVDAVQHVPGALRGIGISEVNVIEDHLAACPVQPHRFTGAGDGVLGLHDLVMAVDGGLCGEGHGEQRADELHGARDDGGGCEERDEGADAHVSAGREDHAHHEGRSQREFRKKRHDHGEIRQRSRFGDFRPAQFLSLFLEVLEGFTAAPERLEHPDPMDRFLHRGGEIAGLVLALPRHSTVRGAEPETVDHER